MDDINFVNYKKGKAKGLMTATKIGQGKIVFTAKRFDINTGAEAEPLSRTVKKEQLLRKKIELESCLADVEEMLLEFTTK